MGTKNMYAHELPDAESYTNGSGRAVNRRLEQQVAKHVAAISTVQKLAPGRTLFSEGDSAEHVFEVIRGTLRLCKLLSDGRRQITGFLSSNRLLGLANEGLYMYTAEAITEVALRRYSRSGFTRLADEMPSFARRLIVMTANELCAAQDQMLLLGRKAAIEKLASFLLQLANAYRTDRNVQIPMTRSDIADYLGLTIETVSRMFTRLRHEAVIDLLSSSCVEILDRDQLEKFAAGDS
jgi:CRP/FNR family transcriptional regulator